MKIPVLNTTSDDFEGRFDALMHRRQKAQGFLGEAGKSKRRVVEDIVDEVRRKGDEALLELTKRFDHVSLTSEQMRVSEEEMDAAEGALEPELREALELAADRIRRFQKHILISDPAFLEEGGRKIGLRYKPVDSAGICVPGASASLASSVLMNVIPAKTAGVRRIVMITPPSEDGKVSDDRLAAARIAGVDEVYRVFGAQAVAALAYGTETIPAVDFIAGPGNAYVAMAKKEVFGQVGIDMIAGPSEEVVLADSSAPSCCVAAELLSQAEHTDGSAILVSPDSRLVEDTISRLDSMLKKLGLSTRVAECLENLGAAIVCRDMKEGGEITNKLAPEHLAIMSNDAEELAGEIRHAGAIFVGNFTPVPVGDYIAGPSHTLPTGTTARFASGLTANSFLKGSSVVSYNRQALKEDMEYLCRIAEAEGLEAHAMAVRARDESS
jgi:histidinol dehydrogenase